jgi:hypothetical protein
MDVTGIISEGVRFIAANLKAQGDWRITNTKSVWNEGRWTELAHDCYVVTVFGERYI